MLINELRGGILTLFTTLRHIWPYFGVKKSKTGVMNEAKIFILLANGGCDMLSLHLQTTSLTFTPNGLFGFKTKNDGKHSKRNEQQRNG